MVYVQRDEKGRLLRVEREPFARMTQCLSSSDPEVQSWFASRSLHDYLMSLQYSDLELVRVIEDLVQVLVGKGVMAFTDLPEPARHKLQLRAHVRSQVGDLDGRVPEDGRLPY